MSRIALIAAILALSACAKSEEASLVPPQEDEGYNMVRPVSSPLVQGNEVALGEWTSGMQEEQATLQFGTAGTEPLFSLRCAEGGALLLQRHGVLSGPGTNMMTLEMGGAVQRLSANSAQGPLPVLRATLPAESALTAQLGQAQGRITVRVGEGEALVLPASPELGTFTQGCGGAGQRQAAAPAPETGNAAAPANSAAPAAAEATGNTAAARPTERRPR